MGKTKTKKRKNRTPCPTGLVSVNETEQIDSDSTEGNDGLSLGQRGNSAVQSALEKLQSTHVEDKECAACSIAMLAAQKDAVAELLSQDAVKIAAPLLLDKSAIVRHSVAGALRNLTAYGGHPVCQILIEQDVLTPLAALLKESYQDWVPGKSAEDKIDSLTEIFIEAINLLWNLCESSPTAVSVFNRENLVHVLINCLKRDVYKFEVLVAAAHCLHAVTEDNKELFDLFVCDPNLLEPVKVLMGLVGDSTADHLLRVLACGITLNLRSVFEPDLGSIITVLSTSIGHDVQPLLETCFGKISELRSKRRRKGPKELPDENEPAGLQKVASQISDVLLAKQLALEMLANVCCSDDSADNWEHLSNSDTSDEMLVESDDEEMQNADSSKCVQNPLSIPCEIHEVVVSLQLVAKVGHHLFLAEDLEGKLNYKPTGHEILKKIHTVQCRALLCLNNLVSGLDIEDFGGTQKLYEVWIDIAKMVFKTAGTEMSEEQLKKDLLEAGTSALRAILQKFADMGGAGWHHFQGTSPKDLEMLFEVERSASVPPLADASIRTNVIRVVSALALLFANSNPGHLPESVEIQTLTKNISLFLLEVSSKDSEVWVSCEALDAIMDVFAEDPMDPIASEIRLTEKLQILLPTLKGRINQQKKRLGIHYPIVMTVRENLARFIKYKVKLTKSIKQAETLQR